MSDKYFDIFNPELNIHNKKLFVIDTNYLLFLFQTEKYYEYYYKALSDFKNDIFIPFSVFVEFIFNLDDVVDKTTGGYEALSSISNINNITSFMDIEDLTRYLDDVIFKKSNLKKNIKGILMDEINEEIDLFLRDMIPEIQGKVQEITSLINDKLQSKRFFSSSREYISGIEKRRKDVFSLFNEITMGEQYSEQKLTDYKKLIQNRYDKNIPPGFEDKDKTSFKQWGNLSIDSKYGDALLWMETIDYIKNCTVNYDEVIIVSDDQKSDWSGVNLITMKIELFQEVKKFLQKFSKEQFIQYALNPSESEMLGIENESNRIEMEQDLDDESDDDWSKEWLFSFNEEEFNAKAQTEMMFEIFNKVISSKKFNELSFDKVDCILFKDPKVTRYNYNEKKKMSKFIKSYKIKTLDDVDVFLGTSLNLNDKFKFISSFMKTNNIENTSLIFNSKIIQDKWNNYK